ncbi:type II toxin-antitoxin system TacA family antitoxin [Actinoallomurus rhizosphaericola]|uniref:type II toxin-antitoxin system TacA family antitoxin n=1 Tax=Actinoallomurus rhizosphaericola TaxID=2952536 RepID=UPI002091AD56|nr:DUF1778 domain-containing protein [Actinoallomurus rhizosphaericola]MCO5994065.1 DUF1778 domain-containing protein [Actinoallomurus rhizosphaericola]
MLMTAKKERRIELRTDATTERLIVRAAEALGESVSSFTLRAAKEEARRILASSDVTWMPADQFDELLATLDEPDDVPALRRAAARPRRYIDET